MLLRSPDSTEAGDAPTRRERRAAAARVWLGRWVFSPLTGMTFGRWWRTLCDNRFRVHPLYALRAGLTTLQALANTFDARREERRFGAQLARILVRRPIFVLGHYRSGTTHLHNLLAVDPRNTAPDNLVATFSRTFLLTEQRKRAWGAKLTMSRRPQDDVLLDLVVPGEDELALCSSTGLSTHMAWHFPARERRYERYLTLREAGAEEREVWKSALLEFARKLTLRSGGRTLVLKSPCHTAKVRWILEVFPDARFVHIDRDPFTIFRSTMKMERTVPPLFTYQRRDPRTIEACVLRRFREMYAAYLEDRQRVPAGQLCEVSFTQLEEDPLGTLERVYAQLGIEGFADARAELEGYLRSIRSYRKNRYSELDPELAARIAREWRQYFDAFGYAAG